MFTKRVARWVAAATILMISSMALADGMIVPIRPDLRVRGNWAVKYHDVSITVRDQVAQVGVDQEFVNTGSGMIEVEYMFPVPPAAAIDAMTLMVDGKEFSAKLMKADEARKVYEEIVRTKKDPALLEYAGYGLVKTSAFPLQPGKPCRVAVNYKMICKKDQDLVEVWYPLNTEKYSAKPIERVKVTADIKAKGDLLSVYSPTHDVSIKRIGGDQVIATYESTNTLPIADFQLFFQESTSDVAATFLTSCASDPAKGGYFMMLVSPNPKAAAQAVVSKDIVMVIDTSGSMSGEKISQAKEALKYTLKNLNREDRFNVVTFSDSVEVCFDTLKEASEKAVADAVDRVDRLEARGGTATYDALDTSLKLFASREGKDAKRPAYLVFLTDGQPTAGKSTDEKDILANTKKINEMGVRLFAFGVGYDVNVKLLDKLVEENNGKSDYVKKGEAADKKVQALYAKIKNPVMTDVTAEIKGLTIKDQYPRTLNDLFEGDQLVILGRYDARELKDMERDGEFKTQLIVRGQYQGKQRTFEYPVSLRLRESDRRFQFVEKLWAMRRVGYLLDQIQLHGQKDNKELIDELIRLSRDYGIMTPYTSFLADERVALGDKPAEKDARFSAFGTGTAGGKLQTHEGWQGQANAAGRGALNDAKQLAQSELKADYDNSLPSANVSRVLGPGGAPTAAPAAPPASSPAVAVAGGMVVGNSGLDAYEHGQKEYVGGMRQAGNQGIYRRQRQEAGKTADVLIASNASNVDLDKDKAKIQDVERFSEDYFKLVRANTKDENEVLATQQAGEDLVIVLRNQAYRIR